MENLPRPAALPTVYSSNPIGNETGDVVNCAIHSRVAAELKSQDTGAFSDIKPLLGAAVEQLNRKVVIKERLMEMGLDATLIKFILLD